MITAKEARILAQEQLDIVASVEIDLIEEQIKEAINNGKFSISNDGSMTPYSKVKLEELGYKVETGTQYNQPWYCIRW